MSNPSVSQLMQTVQRALNAGGRIVRAGFTRHGKTLFKAPVSVVTKIDVASEIAIVKTIQSKFPTHGVLGEEGSYSAKHKKGASSEYQWIVDPLDGTTNFVHHIPQSAVSVAVARNGVVVAGGVLDPHRRELFLAGKGRGATMNGRRIRVTRESRMIRSLFITGFPYDRTTFSKKYLNLIEPFLSQSQGVRRFGAAALDLAWVACGRAEGFFEYKLSPWDVAAGALIVEEAGGKVSDFRGGRYDFMKPVQTLATNRRIHRSVLRCLSRARGQK